MIRILLNETPPSKKIIERDTWRKHYTRRPSANYTILLVYFSYKFYIYYNNLVSNIRNRYRYISKRYITTYESYILMHTNTILCTRKMAIYYYKETNTSAMVERGEMRVNRFNNSINNNINIVLYYNNT